MGTGYLPNPLHHKAEHLLKMPEKLGKDDLYLLLACLYTPGVDVCCLEVGKEEFNRGCIVAVGSCEDARHIVLFQELQSVLAPVIGCIIHHDDMGPPPPRHRAVQEFDQVTEENLHH